MILISTECSVSFKYNLIYSIVSWGNISELNRTKKRNKKEYKGDNDYEQDQLKEISRIK